MYVFNIHDRVASAASRCLDIAISSCNVMREIFSRLAADPGLVSYSLLGFSKAHPNLYMLGPGYCGNTGNTTSGKTIASLNMCWTMPWWRHQMETFSALLAICAENSPFTGEFPAQRPVTRRFDVFFDLRLTKRLSNLNNGEAGDLRHHRAHYDITVMLLN